MRKNNDAHGVTGGALRPDHPLAKGSCLHGIGMAQHCAACAAEGTKHG